MVRSASLPRPRCPDRSSSEVAQAEDAHMETVNGLIQQSIERFGPEPALIIKPGFRTRLPGRGARRARKRAARREEHRRLRREGRRADRAEARARLAPDRGAGKP